MQLPQCCCAGCGTAWLPGEVKSYSSLQGAAGILLCAICSYHEEDYIDEEGTNDIPSLLASYLTNVKQHLQEVET